MHITRTSLHYVTMYACMHYYASMCMYIYIHMYECVHVCAYVYTHVYMYVTYRYVPPTYTSRMLLYTVTTAIYNNSNINHNINHDNRNNDRHND